MAPETAEPASDANYSVRSLKHNGQYEQAVH